MSAARGAPTIGGGVNASLSPIGDAPSDEMRSAVMAESTKNHLLSGLEAAGDADDERWPIPADRDVRDLDQRRLVGRDPGGGALADRLIAIAVGRRRNPAPATFRRRRTPKCRGKRSPALAAPSLIISTVDGHRALLGACLRLHPCIRVLIG